MQMLLLHSNLVREKI